jgi:signal peptidase I
MKSFIGNLLFIAALILITSRFLSVWSGTPFPIDLVKSDSMSPTLMEGDIVAWTPTKIEDINVNDVIVFKSEISWPDEKILVHRVTDILQNKQGEKRLETKGDNNKYIDQAGPHIPEPYIREENIMGKVLSIGQQPLKIPFIGYIGLLINQGLTSLSQSTSSKEPFSFIGIYGPLTLSILVLVVLIFLLPERPKTNKEKIKFNIFGRSSLNLKRTIAIFLIAYIVLFSIIHIFANESITASFGIKENSPDSTFNFGRLNPAGGSIKRPLPVINPGIMPVKGLIFGKGQIKDYVKEEIFQLESGKTISANIEIKTDNNTPNGTYLGEIMVYSSPFWFMFSDELIQSIANLNPHFTVFILDFFSAAILTFITFIILISITFFAEKYSNISIDLSWRYAYRIIIKEKTIKKLSNKKEKFKIILGKNFGWILRADLSKINTKETSVIKYVKPSIPALILIPVLYLIDDKLLAMFLAVIIAGIFAYFISCKLRNKLIITTIVTMGLMITHMVIQSSLIIFSKYETMLEFWAVSLGALGVYILIFTLLLIPLTFISWAIIHLIRNLKEQKDPLLCLEGRCDL